MVRMYEPAIISILSVARPIQSLCLSSRTSWSQPMVHSTSSLDPRSPVWREMRYGRYNIKWEKRENNSKWNENIIIIIMLKVIIIMIIIMISLTIMPIIINMIHRYITSHQILLILIIIKRTFCTDVSKKKVNVPRQK